MQLKSQIRRWMKSSERLKNADRRALGTARRPAARLSRRTGPPRPVAIPRMAGRRLATAYRLGLYPGMQIQPVNDSDAMYPSRQSGSDKITANSMIRPPITARRLHRDCMVFLACLPPEV